MASLYWNTSVYSIWLDLVFDGSSWWEPSTLVNEQPRAFYGRCVCVLQDSASQVESSAEQGRRSRSGGLAAVAYLPFNRDNLGNTDMGPIARSVQHTIHTVHWKLYTLYCRWETWQTWEIHSLLETLKTANYTNLNMDRCTELILVQSAVCALCTVHGARCYGVLQVLCCSTEELLFWELYRFEQTELRTI